MQMLKIVTDRRDTIDPLKRANRHQLPNSLPRGLCSSPKRNQRFPKPLVRHQSSPLSAIVFNQAL